MSFLFGSLFGLICLVIGVALYFLPSIIAFSTGRRNAVAIFVLNLFLGWSVLGWVGALVWACVRDNERLYR